MESIGGTKSYILFLPGVRLTELSSMEDMLNQKITEHIDAPISSTSQETEEYRANPKTFKSLEQWPKSTNLHCWVCDFQFKGRPVFIPMDTIRDKYGEPELVPEGNFCSFSCAQSHIDDKYSRDGSKENKMDMLNMLYNIFHGRPITIIKPSPEKTRMKKYVGESGITKQEYLKLMQEKNSELLLSDYKMEHLSGFLA